MARLGAFYVETTFVFIIIVLLAFVQATSIEHPCKEEADCITSNSTCIGGICRCRDGFFEIPYPTRCLKVPENREEPCEDDEQCTIAFTLGSFCGAMGFCDCHPNYHFSGQLCLLKGLVGINDRCTQDAECAVQYSYCRDGTFCACEEDKATSKDHKRCLPLATKLNDKCEEDIQCTEHLLLGAQCRSGTCQCRELHHYAEKGNENGCYKTKKIGDICDTVNECTSKPDPTRVSCTAVCECNAPHKVSEDKMSCGTGATNDGTAVIGLTALVISSLLAKLVQ